jgi:hypothetical protein
VFGLRYERHRAKVKGYDIGSEELDKTVSVSLVLMEMRRLCRWKDVGGAGGFS